MNRLNFDNLKNLDIPDTWIENALSVPVKSKEKVLSFRNFSRIVATVACLIVVCTTSFSVFLFMNDNGNIPVSNHLSTVDTTEKNGYTQSTVNTVEAADTEIENYFTYSQSSEIIQASTQEATEKTKSSDVTVFTTEPTENLTVDGSLKPQETEIPEYPTFADTVATTAPTVQQQTTIQPQTTIPKTQMPTTTPLVVVPSTTVAPTGDYGWNGIESYGVCYGNFSKTLLVGNIYCRLYDADGKLVGDSNLYSSQHLAHYIIEAGDKIYVQYFLENAGLDLRPGRYKFCFYNENGLDVYQDYISLI